MCIICLCRYHNIACLHIQYNNRYLQHVSNVLFVDDHLNSFLNCKRDIIVDSHGHVYKHKTKIKYVSFLVRFYGIAIFLQETTHLSLYTRSVVRQYVCLGHCLYSPETFVTSIPLFTQRRVILKVKVFTFTSRIPCQYVIFPEKLMHFILPLKHAQESTLD